VLNLKVQSSHGLDRDRDNHQEQQERHQQDHSGQNGKSIPGLGQSKRHPVFSSSLVAPASRSAQMRPGWTALKLELIWLCFVIDDSISGYRSRNVPLL
jgi:hypothetical protein